MGDRSDVRAPLAALLEPAAAKAWKAAERARILALRNALAPAQRAAWNAQVHTHLLQAFHALVGARVRGCVVGLYWPYKGEFDARHAARLWRDQGALSALPVVVAKAQPLAFRHWWPGAPMARGVYDIPIPDGTEVLCPDVLIVPPVGFDAQGFRIGYGGGFYDRTIASLQTRPITIGVAYELCRVPTIHPQDFDLPLDCVVTEEGVFHSPGR